MNCPQCQAARRALGWRFVKFALLGFVIGVGSVSRAPWPSRLNMVGVGLGLMAIQLIEEMRAP